MVQRTSSYLKSIKEIKKAAKLTHKDRINQGFVRWNGYKGKCPLDNSYEEDVTVVLRDNSMHKVVAERCHWDHRGTACDIMYYKAIKKVVFKSEHNGVVLPQGFEVNPYTFKPLSPARINGMNKLLELLSSGKEVEQIYANGSTAISSDPSDLNWKVAGSPHSIIGYREHKKTKGTKLPDDLDAKGYLCNDQSRSSNAFISLAINEGRAVSIARVNGEITTVTNPEDLNWKPHHDSTDIIAFKVMPKKETSEFEEMHDELWNFKNGICTIEKVPSKGVNPKEAFGASNLQVNECSPLLRAYASLGKLNGRLKYGGANYIGTKVVMSTYLHAISRHLDKLVMGQEDDEVDGVPHIAAIAAGLDIILCARAAGTLVDDRLRHDGQLEAYNALIPKVGFLQKLHEGKTPTHFYANAI